MKLTPKKRAKIYLNCAQDIIKSKDYKIWNIWSCYRLNNYYKMKWGGDCINEVGKIFPEYGEILKGCKENKAIAFSMDQNRSISYKEANDNRIIALLFAYYIALDAKE